MKPISVRFCDHRSHASLARGDIAEAQDDDLAGHNFRGPKDRRKAGRDGNLLRTVRGIGDHTTADRAADLLAPQPLAVGGVQAVTSIGVVRNVGGASGRRASPHDNVMYMRLRGGKAAPSASSSPIFDACRLRRAQLQRSSRNAIGRGKKDEGRPLAMAN